ncbi:MAG: DUF1569 domain-containing protein [Bacteroidetes bacterium]|nr:DUF1569 domain-containing protein [Bacteroidota bacterium]
MINIFNNGELDLALAKLKHDATPLFGKMSPQHVVEHLAKTVKVSTGKIPVKMFLNAEDGEALKQKLIFGETMLQPGIKSPLMGEEPPALVHSDFPTAVEELYKEIANFNQYYSQNPEAKHTHPRMGELKYPEWKVFHNKHFTHHFNQYGLL